jgi:MFS family permease
MLSLAREVYTPVPGSHSKALRDPEELSGPGLVSREIVERHLLDAFIPAAYRRPPGRADRRGRSWRAEEAEPWLAFLAGHLERTITSPGFGWWQLERAVPRAVSRMAATVVVVVGWGITLAITEGSAAGASARLISGLAVGLTAGLTIWRIGRQPQNPMTAVGWSLRHVLRWARRPTVWRGWRPGQFVMLAIGTSLVGLILTAAVFGFAAEPAWLLVSLAVLGIHGVYGDLAAIATPKALLARERRSYLLLGIMASVYGTAAGFVLGTACGHAARTLFGVADGPSLGASAGIAFGVTFALGLGMVGAAWSRFRVSSMLLALRRRLPWRLMSFLDDAHKQGVLRQAGAVYQFRHLELQHRLATRLQDHDDPSSLPPS